MDLVVELGYLMILCGELSSESLHFYAHFCILLAELDGVVEFAWLGIFS